MHISKKSVIKTATCELHCYSHFSFYPPLKEKSLHKGYFRIDQHLARHLKYNGAGLSSPSLSMQSNNYSLF